MIDLLIADDQRLFADMLKTILQSYPDFRVVAYAANGTEAIAQYEIHRPDICLLDIQMPGTDGLHALKTLKELYPAVKIIMLTTFSDDENILKAYCLGADGYILKDILPESLIQAILCVHNGLCVSNHSVQAFIAKALQAQKHSSPSCEQSFPFDGRDMDIILHIAQGLSNKAIAERMNYSEGTVRNRISNILSMTGLKDRTQIALFAIKNRLI